MVDTTMVSCKGLRDVLKASTPQLDCSAKIQGFQRPRDFESILETCLDDWARHHCAWTCCKLTANQKTKTSKGTKRTHAFPRKEASVSKTCPPARLWPLLPGASTPSTSSCGQGRPHAQGDALKSFLYVKVPKSASTTIAEIFRQTAELRGFQLLSPPEEDWNLRRSQREFLEQQSMVRGSIDHIAHYGSWLSCLPALEHAARVTSIREPFSRAKSLYWHTHSSIHLGIGGKMCQAPSEAIEQGISAFLSHCDDSIKLQSTYISPDSGRHGWKGSVDQMLEHYDVIIVVERMLESLAVLHFAFGLQPDELMFMQANTLQEREVKLGNHERTRFETFKGDVENAWEADRQTPAIRAKFQLDIDLYAAVQQRLDQQLAALEQQGAPVRSFVDFLQKRMLAVQTCASKLPYDQPRRCLWRNQACFFDEVQRCYAEVEALPPHNGSHWPCAKVERSANSTVHNALSSASAGTNPSRGLSSHEHATKSSPSKSHWRSIQDKYSVAGHHTMAHAVAGHGEEHRAGHAAGLRAGGGAVNKEHAANHAGGGGKHSASPSRSHKGGAEKAEARPRGMIVYLAQAGKHSSYGRDSGEMLSRSLELLFKNYNEKHRDQVLILHTGDFTPEQQASMLAPYPGRPVKFHLLTGKYWELPPYVDGRPEEKAKWVKYPMFSVGYRHMIRFFTWGVWELAAELGFDYVMRMDEDSYLLSPIDYNIFDFMHSRDLVYGYRQAAWEVGAGSNYDLNSSYYIDYHPFVRSFLEEHASQPEWLLDSCPEPRSVSGFTFDRCGEPYGFYNNFFVTKVEFWRSAAVRQFLDYVDHAGVIYKQRWNDILWHSASVQIFAPKKKVHLFQDFTYQHATIDVAGDDLNCSIYGGIAQGSLDPQGPAQVEAFWRNYGCPHRRQSCLQRWRIKHPTSKGKVTLVAVSQGKVTIEQPSCSQRTPPYPAYCEAHRVAPTLKHVPPQRFFPMRDALCGYTKKPLPPEEYRQQTEKFWRTAE